MRKFPKLINLYFVVFLFLALAACSKGNGFEPVMPDDEMIADEEAPDWSPDEYGRPPEGAEQGVELVSLEYFLKCVEGKTFKCVKNEYVDSRGNVFTQNEFMSDGICGYAQNFYGFSCNGDKMRLAIQGVHQPKQSYSGAWSYDESTGFLIVMPPDTYGYRYLIESVADDQVVVRKDWGIVAEWLYERLNGLEYPEDCGWDESSYARVTLKLVSDTDAEEFWTNFPASSELSVPIVME